MLGRTTLPGLIRALNARRLLTLRRGSFRQLHVSFTGSISSVCGLAVDIFFRAVDSAVLIWICGDSELTADIDCIRKEWRSVSDGTPDIVPDLQASVGTILIP
jgi:hypothetical protein